MSEVIVAFWTGTGNTAEMAEYVAEGIKEGGAEAKVVSVDDISAADLKDAKAFALGCPSMGVEQLEESTWNHLLKKSADSLQEKQSDYSDLTDGETENG